MNFLEIHLCMILIFSPKSYYPSILFFLKLLNSLHRSSFQEVCLTQKNLNILLSAYSKMEIMNGLGENFTQKHRENIEVIKPFCFVNL